MTPLRSLFVLSWLCALGAQNAPRASAETTAVEGRIADLLGDPVPAARVWAVDPRHPDERLAASVADGDGIFRLGRVPVRTLLHVHATASGFCIGTAVVQPGAPVFVPLQHATKVAGVLRNRAGAPVANVTVRADVCSRVLRDVESLATTDKDGRFELRDAPFGPIRVRAWVPLDGVAEAFANVAGPTELGLRVPRVACTTLTIQVTDLPAEAVDDVVVDLRTIDERGESRLPPPYTFPATDRGFAAAAAEMLKPADDLHLYLRLGEQTFGTGSRAVDSLFRRPLVDKLVKVAPVGAQALAGRTEDGIGYLLIAAWNQDVDPERIGGAITELADTKAMVIDVRPNAGGDESLAAKVAAWFVTGTRTYAKNRYRGPGNDGFGPLLERQVTGNGENRHYDGPIAVLTSRYVMSSNESFVLMCRQAKDCVVVGQPTFGSSGNPKPFELGNGVTALIPSWQDLRPDGTPFEGQGLAPDVLVECKAQDLETHDPILEKALELLRAKVAPAK